MRLFAEELNTGSYETLLTLPVTFRDIILGKFLAGVIFVSAILVPTLVYPVFIAMMGELDWGPVIGGYAGAVMLGAAFTAIGLFASALTRNQIIAFIMGAVICFALTTMDRMLFFFPTPVLNVVNYLGASSHFQNVAKGIIDSRDILYFLSLVFLGLYAAHLAMQEKK
jgi:ABC-2 type transport system permease protein